MMQATTQKNSNGLLEKPHYWLSERGGAWREVSLRDFISAEERAGLRSRAEGKPATGGFGWSRPSGERLDGIVIYGNQRPKELKVL